MYLRYHGGTLVLEEPAPVALPPLFEWIKGKPRCPAYHYPQVRDWLRAVNGRNGVPRWQTLDLRLDDARQPYLYQTEALEAWLNADSRGGVVLPTGAGKTLLALHAIARMNCSTLVIVPTIDLLHQWYARLCTAFPTQEIGVYYGGEKELRDITVTTYHSASILIGDWGNRFKLLVFDEVHHLPGPAWQEIALMSAAPHRLGLTATYPEPNKPFSGDARYPLDQLIGPLVYVKQIDELSGHELAAYRTVHIRVDLTEAEQRAYDDAYAQYVGYAREAGLRESYGGGWWREYTRRSAFNAEARTAKVAERRLRRIVATAHNKLAVLDNLLKEHAGERVLIFTEQNELVYTISRRHLIPAITHQTVARERRALLDNFRDGSLCTIVTSRVLNEGIDVPEAKIAVILGGSASAREYTQRLGRILRKRDNQTALLYEVVTNTTIEINTSQRRRRTVEYTTS